MGPHLWPGLVAFEIDHNIFVSDKTLAGHAVSGWNIVDLGVENLRRRDLTELAQDFLFLLGHCDAVGALVREGPHLHQARSAFAVTAVERDWNFVRLGDRKDRTAVSGDRVNCYVVLHHRGREYHIGHELGSWG